ncbi:YhgE/Pip domain-containing protein [Virgibacillus chiguensis]|uniref:Putative membrane protein n=1 Tax=Virgibacillus chiguensis TaxID=411959 RepID=A0A1M5SGF3_9BACI|nr:YhgE/Pip domain-containing protein [Virgibacillus chiguensis]SHH37559.1 putative membrane protein [Virgibacillus chiguensis]
MGKSGYISAEIKRIFQNKHVILTVSLAIFVPLLYAMIMLSPKWGPYDNTNNLPVAVVNKDQGAMSDGERLNIGDSLMASLKENELLGWEFVSSKEAKKGMDNMKYYMMIEVPEDFSTKALTVLDEEPIRPTLQYTQNEGLHFMAAQVTDKAAESIKTQLSTQITTTYVENVVAQLKEVSGGFTEASDGAKQINHGSNELKNGSEQILDSLNEKSSDIKRLADGAQQLEDGSQTMKESLVYKQKDITSLANGARELNIGTGTLLSNLQNKTNDVTKLADGSSQVHEGTIQLMNALQEKSADITRLSNGASELADGANELHTGSTNLLTGAKQAKDGTTQLKNGLSERIIPGSEQLATGVQQAQAGVHDTIQSMQSLQTALQELPNSVDGLEDNALYNIIMAQLNETLKTSPQKQKDFQKLVNGANQLRDGLKNELSVGVTDLNNGLEQLVEGQQQFQNGIIELEEGANEVAAGNKTVETGWKELQTNVATLQEGTKQIKDGNLTVKSGWSELTAGTEQLYNGSRQVRDGNKTVELGWQELSAGAIELEDGSSQVRAGNQTVEEGWETLTDGVTQVDGGLAELSDGSEELQAGLEEGATQTNNLNLAEENISMFAEPVVLDGEVMNSFPFYRDSNAPYILTLALYVGILIMSFAVKYRHPVIIPPSATAWFTGKAIKLIMLAILQALILSLYTLVFLNLDVQSGVSFVLLSIMVSLTFLMIILFLVSAAGNVGRFIALAFVILQLPTTGSSLPIDMLPEELRQMSTFLPFTYSLESYRSIITLGITSNTWESVGVLFLYFSIFTLLSMIVFYIRFKSMRKQMHYQNSNAKESVS